MKEDLDLEQLKQDLEERRAVLLSRVHVKSDASPSKAMNPDRADLAQDYFLQERTSALQDRLEGTLEQVEAALQRLEDGSYGKCARCGGNIPAARLGALPYAELCIACQKLTEG